jgi:hypothetical protein
MAPLSNSERSRRYRARKREQYENGIPAGTKTRYGWLHDDGIIDEQAIQMVVGGQRIGNPPDLTHREALMVVSRLTALAMKHKHTSARDLVAARLGVTRNRAESLMTTVREYKSKGESIG